MRLVAWRDVTIYTHTTGENAVLWFGNGECEGIGNNYQYTQATGVQAKGHGAAERLADGDGCVISIRPLSSCTSSPMFGASYSPSTMLGPRAVRLALPCLAVRGCGCVGWVCLSTINLIPFFVNDCTKPGRMRACSCSICRNKGVAAVTTVARAITVAVANVDGSVIASPLYVCVCLRAGC